MPDPLMRRAGTIDDKLNELMPLFAPPPQLSTSQLAHAASSKNFTRREQEIIDLLDRHGPQCLFELAELLGVQDHTISGRITSLKDARKIEPTGERRTKPSTGRSAEVYRLVTGRIAP